LVGGGGVLVGGGVSVGTGVAVGVGGSGVLVSGRGEGVLVGAGVGVESGVWVAVAVSAGGVAVGISGEGVVAIATTVGDAVGCVDPQAATSAATMITISNPSITFPVDNLLIVVPLYRR